MGLLPQRLRLLSRLPNEIALPYPEVIEAVDALEAAGIYLLGWEGLAVWPDGRVGGYPGELFGGLDMNPPDADTDWSRAVAASADRHRATIADEVKMRRWFPPLEGVELVFCLTAQARPS